jgi:hypothetical protein
VHRGEGERLENEKVESAAEDVSSGGRGRHGAEGRGQRAEGRGQRAREAASAPLGFRQKFDGVLSKVKRSGTTGLFRHLAL